MHARTTRINTTTPPISITPSPPSYTHTHTHTPSQPSNTLLRSFAARPSLTMLFARSMVAATLFAVVATITIAAAPVEADSVLFHKVAPVVHDYTVRIPSRGKQMRAKRQLIDTEEQRLD